MVAFFGVASPKLRLSFCPAPSVKFRAELEFHQLVFLVLSPECDPRVSVATLK